MSDVKNTNNYTYDPENIAKALQRAMSQNAAPSVVKYLNNARKEKIASGGESTAMYEGDALTKAADEYENRFAKSDVSKLHEARRNSLTEGLKNAHQAAKNIYENGVKASDEDYSEARRLFIADAHKKNLDTEEGLARLGLGMGASNGATSGIGESARVKMLSDAAEGLRKLYADEAKTKNDLSGKLADDYYKAYEKYSEGIDKTYYDQSQDSLEADKAYTDNKISLLKVNDTRQQSDRDFEYEKQTNNEKSEFEKAYKAFEATGAVQGQEQADVLGLNVGDTTLEAEKIAFENAYHEKQLENDDEKEEFDNAYALFEAVGIVATQEMADILGIPIGTRYWKYVTDSVKANASSVNASANSSRAAATQQNANTNTYKSETDRMELKNKITNDLKKELQEKKDAKE